MKIPFRVLLWHRSGFYFIWAPNYDTSISTLFPFLFDPDVIISFQRSKIVTVLLIVHHFELVSVFRQSTHIRQFNLSSPWIYIYVCEMGEIIIITLISSKAYKPSPPPPSPRLFRIERAAFQSVLPFEILGLGGKFS